MNVSSIPELVFKGQILDTKIKKFLRFIIQTVSKELVRKKDVRFKNQPGFKKAIANVELMQAFTLKMVHFSTITLEVTMFRALLLLSIQAKK